MMNLLANMDLRNTKILAKANGIELYYPPDKSGGNSKSEGNSKLNINGFLSHLIKKIE